MSDSGLAADELVTWLLPRQALTLIQERIPDIGVASRAILERLKGGQIRAASKSAAFENPTELKLGFLIPQRYWSQVSSKSPDWWDTADINFSLHLFAGSKHSMHRTVRVFGIRFDPAGISAMIADLPKPFPILPTQKEKVATVDLPVRTETAPDKTISPEEFLAWLAPNESLAVLQRALGAEAAVTAIMERLRGSVLKSAAAIESWKTGFNPPELSEFVPIDGDFWGHIQGIDSKHSFWKTGDATIYLDPTSRLVADPTTVRYCGVRFEPNGVRALLPKDFNPQAGPSAAPDPSPTTEIAEQEEENGRPVAEGHLKEWYALYTKLFTEAEQTEDHAWKSAEGMFPGKSVTRAAIRKLRGTGTLKRGRKPTAKNV